MKQWSRWRNMLTAVLALSLSHSLAQQWKAELPAVEKAGIYQILLSPEMVGRSKEGLGDLRLVDDLGIPVPHVLEIATRTETRELVPLTIIRNEILPRSTVVEIDNKGGGHLKTIHLVVRNAKVIKRVRLTGSDDAANWFMLGDEQVILSGGGVGDAPNEILPIAVPSSDQRYFRIVIDDSLTAPVQVLSAKKEQVDRGREQFVSHVPLDWEQDDGSSETRLHVYSRFPFIVDRLELPCGGDSADIDRHFRRPCRLVQRQNRSSGSGSRKRVWNEEVSLATFTLSSDRDELIDLGGIRVDTFDIVVENGDDRPLHFMHVGLFQLERSLTAELQPGKRYTLTTGDPKKSAPQYDIVHFKDKLPEPIATIAHGPLIALAATPEMGPSIAPSRWWIWAGLVAVLGIVAIMAVRMLREPQQPNG